MLYQTAIFLSVSWSSTISTQYASTKTSCARLADVAKQRESKQITMFWRHPNAKLPCWTQEPVWVQFGSVYDKENYSINEEVMGVEATLSYSD
jgi:hypothetical protein